MSDQATARPWHSEKWPHEKECIGADMGSLALVAPDGISPGVVWGGLVASDANARLIVAAVNSYEAHQRAAEALRQLCETLDKQWFEADPDAGYADSVKPGESHPWTTNARAALAELDRVQR